MYFDKPPSSGTVDNLSIRDVASFPQNAYLLLPPKDGALKKRIDQPLSRDRTVDNVAVAYASNHARAEVRPRRTDGLCKCVDIAYFHHAIILEQLKASYDA